MTRYAIRLPLMALCLTVAYGAGAARPSETLRLFLNGKVISTKVCVLEELAYVPVADVAVAFRCTVARQDDDYSLETDELPHSQHSRGWHLAVSDLQEGDRYSHRFTRDQAVLKTDAGRKLVSVFCTLKNRIDLGAQVKDLRSSAALIDTRGDRYALEALDAPKKQEVPSGLELTFAMVFSLPEDRTPQQLVLSPKVRVISRLTTGLDAFLNRQNEAELEPLT